MTRGELLQDVIDPWKPGRITQMKRNNIPNNNWSDRPSCDPINLSYDLCQYEYRIKPRVVKYLIETEHYPSQFDFPAVADCMEKVSEGCFPPSFIEAVRNAKRVDE